MDKVIFFARIDKCSDSEYMIEKKAELPKGSFYRWRNGRANPSYEALKKLADYLDVSLDYLVGRESPTKSTTASPAPLDQPSPDPKLQEFLKPWEELDDSTKDAVIAYTRKRADILSDEKDLDKSQRPNRKMGGGY